MNVDVCAAAVSAGIGDGCAASGFAGCDGCAAAVSAGIGDG